MLLMVTCRYGTFSDGLGADERPYLWEGSVVTLYAETNRGMSGVVLSTKFSVGYLVHSDAAAARLRFATLLNTAGSEYRQIIAIISISIGAFSIIITTVIIATVDVCRWRCCYKLSRCSVYGLQLHFCV